VLLLFSETTTVFLRPSVYLFDMELGKENSDVQAEVQVNATPTNRKQKAVSTTRKDKCKTRKWSDGGHKQHCSSFAKSYGRISIAESTAISFAKHVDTVCKGLAKARQRKTFKTKFSTNATQHNIWHKTANKLSIVLHSINTR